MNFSIITDNVKYKGVGGHLFAIAANKSIEEEQAKKIAEVYTYEWTDDKI